jgi:hypothetical protein
MSRSGPAKILASCALGLLHCAGSSDDEAVGTSREAIVGGSLADAPASPVLYLTGPGGSCTAVLVGPTLAATAAHCVTYLVDDGPFECTPSGQLQDGSISGELSSQYAPSSLGFFSSESVASHRPLNGSPPDAIGSTIVSTNTTSVCGDDLAFVVLNQPIPGLVPAPIWLGSISDGDPINVWGYGLTGIPEEPLALRVSQGAEIVGVGPTESSTLTGQAPVRSVRIGPGTTTCNGDSGGPILSKEGALIAIVSLGLQSNNGLDCTSGNNPDTTGPLLADYKYLVDHALAAAAPPPGEDAAADAQTDSGHNGDTGTPGTDGADSPESSEVLSGFTAEGGSCSVPSVRAGSPMGLGGVALAMAGAVGAIGRRRRS